MAIRLITNTLAILIMPFFLTGVVNRVKSLWSGRKGPPLIQPAFDVLRLLRKSSTYSETSTPIFRIGPLVFLVSAVASAVVTPMLGSHAIASFAFDFVCFAYIWALGRVALMLAALDTGSAFEGMGTAREATFSALLEPALFLVLGALCLSAGSHSLRDALILHANGGNGSSWVWLGSVITLLIVLQVENARMPVDDPTTHLELTMVHEVMVLDHSGPELAAIQYGAALKLFVGASILATLLNPWASVGGVTSSLAYVGLCIGIAVLVGTVESLMARLRLRAVPMYIAVAVVSAGVALLATAWRTGGPL